MKKRQKSNPVNRLLSKAVPLMLLMFLTGISNGIFAQQLTPTLIGSAGETLTNGEVTLTFSIGEPVTETFSGGGIMLTQGFLQGQSGKIGIDENQSKKDFFTLYPNPVSQKLFLRMIGKLQQGSYMIKNLQGKTLCKGTISGVVSTVSLEGYAPGLYLVTVRLNNTSYVNKLFVKK